MQREEPETITLVLADDHPVAREGVRGMLARAPDIRIIGEAQDGNEAMELVARLQPQILLLDLKMPGIPSFEVERWVRENHPETVTLVLTAHDRDVYPAAMMDAGAAGYLSKAERAENLIEAIRRAAHGGRVFTAEQIERVKKWRRGAAGKWEKLTEREHQVLRLLAQGWSNRQIAEELGVARKTVACHISTILDRLEVESRQKAVAWLREYFPDELE